MASMSIAAETFKRVYPSEFHAKFLEAGVRPDGRTMLAARPCTVHTGSIATADASALVTLGRTTVICGIKAEFTNPPLQNEDEGWLVVNVALPPLCSPDIRPGLPTPEAQSLSHFVHQVIHRAKVIDVKSLCIVPKKLAWVLHVDVNCLNYDGNVVDAALLAVTAALQSTTLPRVLLPEEEGAEMTAVPPVDLQDRQPLKIQRRLCSATFVVMAPDIVMLDPTVEEEELAAASATIVMDSDGTVHAMEIPAPHMQGTVINECQGLESKIVMSLLAPAKTRAAELHKLVISACK